MNIITKIRESYFTRGLAFTLALNILFEIVWPTAAMAITSGPSQPEVQSFEPVGTTDMVNMFTGDFTYNIPLINLPGPNGGYPVNLAYHAGIGMEQEASWVGLGWNINAGALVRDVRGLADDYDGDIVHSEMDMKPNRTVGLNFNQKVEFFGGEAVKPWSWNTGIRYNNYKGFGWSAGAKLPLTDDFQMGISLDSENGLGLLVNYTMKGRWKENASNTYGLSYSNQGLGISTSRSVERSYKNQSRDSFSEQSGTLHEETPSGSSGIGFSVNMHQPVFSIPISSNNLNVSVKLGAGAGIYGNGTWSGFYLTQHIPNKIQEEGLDFNAFGYENLHNYENSEYVNDKRQELLDFSREKDGTVSPMMSNVAAPSLNYDVYSVLGQGIGGMFRPFRTDIGRVHDPKLKNVVFGGSVSYDMGAGHVGIGLTSTFGDTKQKPWNRKNDWKEFTFKDNKKESIEINSENYDYFQYERVYYRMHGDKSALETDELDFIGGEEPLATEANTEIFDKLQKLTVPTGIKNEREEANLAKKRISRNTLIHKFKNNELTRLYAESTEIEDENDLIPYSDLSETSIFYYNWDEGQSWLPIAQTTPSDPDKFLERSARNNKDISKQNGAYKILNEQGQYYVYGLPAYNNLEKEVAFSVKATSTYVEPSDADPLHSAPFVNFETTGSGTSEKVDHKFDSSTDQFLQSTEKPPYAHSYMLSSVLGADYVDVDFNGPSDEDLGYWVKFDYTKYSDDYAWRMPYEGANYSPGQLTTLSDDKGSYTYGEKELWYVSRIETKTHILIFEFEERSDNVEAMGEFSQITNSVDLNGKQSGLLIKKMSLYLKEDYENNGSEDAVALKEVNFEYDYSLCGNVRNNNGDIPGTGSAVIDNDEKGKLTLKKIWFTSEGSTKGSLRPYEFSYYNQPLSTEGEITYNQNEYDRWGNYKPLTVDDDEFSHKNLPYTKQDEAQSESDNNASAWSLKTIKMPTGGEINIEYEADDYAFVQSETATQMMEVTSVNDGQTGDDILYDEDVNCNNTQMKELRNRRIYFKLETPLLTGDYTNLNDRAEKVYKDYIEGLIIDGKGDRNLYFKNYTQLRPADDNSYDYVSGYAPIMDYNGSWQEGDTNCFEISNDYKFGLAGEDNGYYTEGFLTLKKHIKRVKYNEGGEIIKIKESDKFHPMAVAAWEHLRLNDPLLLNIPANSDLTNGTEEVDDDNKAEQVASLLGAIPQIAQMFSGVHAHCFNNKFGQKIDVSGKSVIRLCTPDMKKIGGGHRVKQIKVSDNWNDFSGEQTSEYGVVYEYKKSIPAENQTTEVISSGVAQYEPMLGGDEIALRFPKFYVDNIPFNTDQRSYFEHPLNENYYPAPTIGYSKVTVRSLNTKTLMDGNSHIGQGTTGVTEYEFYTAKDFPVIVKEAPIVKSKFNVTIPIPFIGVFERKRVKAAQAYVIELNDMHGQLKSIRKYGLDKDHQKIPYTTSLVKYVYNANMNHHMVINEKYSKKVGRLKNKVNTISQDLGPSPTVEFRMIGVEYEVCTDQRQNRSYTTVAGGDANFDFPGFAFAGFWPAFSSIKRDMKTFVTNKILFKSGIVKEVHTYDGRSRVISKNEIYDAETGRPVLTSVNNEFEDDIYKYSHPAHWEYDGMASAYENINLEFDAKLIDVFSVSTGLEGQYIIQTAPAIINQLVSGDFLTAWVDDISFTATYIEKVDSFKGIIHLERVGGSKDDGSTLLTSGDLFRMKVIRSGRRNLIYTDAGSIVSKSNPLTVSARTAVGVSETENVASETFNIAFNNYEVDDILNGTAVLFKDEWVGVRDPLMYSNPYSTGNAGIWRPYKSYVYVGERTAGPNTGQPLVKTDIQNNGVMNDVELFNWQIQNFEKYAPNWQWTSEIRKYNSEAFETENIDRLGIKSAALYAHRSSLLIAAGSNAGYHEIGTEDFERYEIGETIYAAGKEESDDNIGFFNSQVNSYASNAIRTYEIIGGKTLSNGEFKIELNTEEDFSSISNLDITLQTSEFDNSTQAKNYIFSVDVLSDLTTTGNVILHVKAKHIYDNLGSLSLLGVGKYVSGIATTARVLDVSQNFNATGVVTFDASKKHTGKKSMKFETDENGFNFPLGRLDLIKDKTYHFSSWISQDDVRKLDFENVSLDIMEFDGTNWVSISDNLTIKKGKIIEGWQKIDFEFSPTTDNRLLSIYLESVDGTTPINTYIDDIRIAPKTGGIVTYVYDSHNFRLHATLDENNYATFYYYDEEGNLHLVKRETERGVMTISENRGNTKK